MKWLGEIRAIRVSAVAQRQSTEPALALNGGRGFESRPRYEEPAIPNGQWRGSTRRQRLPADWPQRCAMAREVYGTTCYLCHHEAASDTDHVNRGDDHSVSNLRPICGTRCQQCAAENRTPCHAAKSSREGGQAAQAARPRRQRPAEPHPGMR